MVFGSFLYKEKKIPLPQLIGERSKKYLVISFGRRRNEVTSVVKVESIQCTNLSRSFDTRPLKVFIMNSILSFIIYISTTMYGGVVSATDGWQVSWCSCLLEALLPSSPSWSLLSALVPFCSSPWLLGPMFLWRNYSSRSWFFLVRCSTVVAIVCTCLSRAVVCGSSPWLLLVAIEWVSTIQLFVWEMVVWLLLW